MFFCGCFYLSCWITQEAQWFHSHGTILSIIYAIQQTQLGYHHDESVFRWRDQPWAAFSRIYWMNFLRGNRQKQDHLTIKRSSCCRSPRMRSLSCPSSQIQDLIVKTIEQKCSANSLQERSCALPNEQYLRRVVSSKPLHWQQPFIYPDTVCQLEISWFGFVPRPEPTNEPSSNFLSLDFAWRFLCLLFSTWNSHKSILLDFSDLFSQYVLCMCVFVLTFFLSFGHLSHKIISKTCNHLLMCLCLTWNRTVIVLYI